MTSANSPPLEGLYDALMAAMPCLLDLRSETDPKTLAMFDDAFVQKTGGGDPTSDAATLLVILA